MGLRKWLAQKEKQYNMYINDKDHISALIFDAKRKFDAGLISELKYERLIQEAKDKETKLKDLREHYWQVDDSRKENHK